MSQNNTSVKFVTEFSRNDVYVVVYKCRNIIPKCLM